MNYSPRPNDTIMQIVGSGTKQIFISIREPLPKGLLLREYIAAATIQPLAKLKTNWSLTRKYYISILHYILPFNIASLIQLTLTLTEVPAAVHTHPHTNTCSKW